MGDSNNKYTYSWTKNKELIPVRTESEKYDILYPGGSILHIFKIDVSVKPCFHWQRRICHVHCAIEIFFGKKFTGYLYNVIKKKSAIFYILNNG
jgi:hypothetical protein